MRRERTGRAERVMTEEERKECALHVHELCRESSGLLATDIPKSLSVARAAYRAATSCGHRLSIGMALNAMATAHLHVGEYGRSRRYYRKAVELLDPTVDDELKLLCIVKRGFGASEIRCGRYAHALDPLSEALELAERVGNRERMATILGEMGTALKYMGDYGRALDLLLQSKEIIDEYGDHGKCGIAALKLASAYSNIDMFTRAIETYREGLDHFRALGNIAMQGCVLGSIGAIYFKIGEFDIALEILSDALTKLHESGRRNDEGNALRNMGLIYKEFGDYEKALEMLEHAKRIFEEIKSEVYCTVVTIDLAEVTFFLGDDQRALAAVQSILLHSGTFEEKVLYASSLDLLARIHEHRGELAEALTLYRKADQIQKRIVASKRSREAVMVEVRDEMRRIERERDDFRRRTETLEKMIEQQRSASVIDLFRDMRRDAAGETAPTVTSSCEGSVPAPAERDLRDRLLHGRNTPWPDFQRRFDQVVPGFVRTLLDRGADLSPAEIRVCCLLRLGLASKEIAETLCTSIRTVDNHRRHIRRKLAIPTSINLVSHFMML